MTHPTRMRLHSITLGLALAATACGDDDTGTGGATSTSASGTTRTGSGAAADPFAACTKGELEADLVVEAPLTGPGVGEDGALAPGNYFVATTYLAMVPAEVERARTLGGDVVQSLSSAEGLVAFSLGGSQSCVSLRTLTVWRSEEDMMAFVVSPAHATAMAQTSSLSRGTSDTLSWEGDEKTATWAEAATRLGSETKGDR